MRDKFPLGMDYWWDRWCEEEQNGCEDADNVSIYGACMFAEWFAQQAEK